MKLQIFQSEKGDCILLESADGRRILCDGGMASTMRSQVRAQLGKLRKAKQKIDVVYVSHIDSDHISGVLALLEDELTWRLHEHRVKNGIKQKVPQVPRPPEIGGVWHNAFRDQVEDNADSIEKLLAAAVPTLNGTCVDALRGVASQFEELATSVTEALQVSHLVSPELLKIPVNRIPGRNGKAKLLMLRPRQPAIALGSLKITIVGPGRQELENLRKGWNTWLAENEKTVAATRAAMKKRVDEFSAGALNGAQPFDLRDWNGIPDFEGVTAPNIASLMLMVEEAGKRVLLTGDSQQKFILDGLAAAGFIERDGAIHLDVLKVQHHGSENNMDPQFCRQVSADHYVFCGNGKHGNPDLGILDMIVESRLGAKAKRALAPRAEGRPFTFWFSTTSAAQKANSKEQGVFEAVEARVASLRRASKGQLKVKYNSRASVTLAV